MSSRNNHRGRRRTRKQEWENVQERNETSENVNRLNDVEIEFRDVVDKRKLEREHVEEWDNKQEIVGHRKKKERLKRNFTEHRTQDINSSILNGENSCNDTFPNNVKKGTSLKMKPDLSNGKVDVNTDVCGVEDNMQECCARKWKRCGCECYSNKSKGSGLTCIGILPGVKSIIESSDDSDQSCSSDSEGNENNKYDLLGRKINYVAKKSSESK